MLASATSGMIDTLKSLLDELCSADLTLGRAALLRSRVMEIVEALEGNKEQ
jgi:hypothetical protein